MRPGYEVGQHSTSSHVAHIGMCMYMYGIHGVRDGMEQDTLPEMMAASTSLNTPTLINLGTTTIHFPPATPISLLGIDAVAVAES